MQFTLDLAPRESDFNLLTSGPGSPLVMVLGFRYGLTAKVKNTNHECPAQEPTELSQDVRTDDATADEDAEAPGEASNRGPGMAPPARLPQ